MQFLSCLHHDQYQKANYILNSGTELEEELWSQQKFENKTGFTLPFSTMPKTVM